MELLVNMELVILINMSWTGYMNHMDNKTGL